MKDVAGRQALRATNQVVEGEWVTFRGGELEGRRPKAMCAACRQQLAGLARAARVPGRDPRPICFHCYLADLERQRALRAAADLDTSSVERFQEGLPFEPVNRVRLERLKAERVDARLATHTGTGRFVDKRRQAQIAARHALQRLAAGLDQRQLAPVERERFQSAAMHAAELQLPEAWLPFVGSRNG